MDAYRHYDGFVVYGLHRNIGDSLQLRRRGSKRGFSCVQRPIKLHNGNYAMKILKVLFLGLLLGAGQKAFSQTGTLPPATPSSATVPWTLPSNCTAATTCQFQVYRITGVCPATLAGSTGWTLIATTASQATSYVDTAVTGGTTYSYDIEAVPTGSTLILSGPSNCSTGTTPFTPQPVVIGVVTTV
jgi:hypothetical protein